MDPTEEPQTQERGTLLGGQRRVSYRRGKWVRKGNLVKKKDQSSTSSLQRSCGQGKCPTGRTRDRVNRDTK